MSVRGCWPATVKRIINSPQNGAEEKMMRVPENCHNAERNQYVFRLEGLVSSLLYPCILGLIWDWL